MCGLAVCENCARTEIMTHSKGCNTGPVYPSRHKPEQHRRCARDALASPTPVTSRVAYTRYSSHDNIEETPICNIRCKTNVFYSCVHLPALRGVLFIG